MKGGNQKDSSDESRGTPFGVRTSNRASIRRISSRSISSRGCRRAAWQRRRLAGRIDTIRGDLESLTNIAPQRAEAIARDNATGREDCSRFGVDKKALRLLPLRPG